VALLGPGPGGGGRCCQTAHPPPPPSRPPAARARTPPPCRQPLTPDMLVADTELKARIDAWLAEQRASRGGAR